MVIRRINTLALFSFLSFLFFGCITALRHIPSAIERNKQVQTREAYKFINESYEFTQEAYDKQRLTEPQKNFLEISHNLVAFRFLNYYNELFIDSSKVVGIMDVAIDCDQIFFNVPNSNPSDVISDRIFYIVNVFTQYEGVKIQSIETELPFGRYFTYLVDFMDNNDIKGDDQGLTIIYGVNKEGFFYLEKSCWLY